MSSTSDPASQPENRERPNCDPSWLLQLLSLPLASEAAQAILRYIGELTSEKAWELPTGKALVELVQDFRKQLVLDKLKKDEEAVAQIWWQNTKVGRPHIEKGTHEDDIMKYSRFGWGEHGIASAGALKSLLEEGLIQATTNLHTMQTVRWGPGGRTIYETDGSSYWRRNLQLPWEARAEQDSRTGTWYVRTKRALVQYIFG